MLNHLTPIDIVVVILIHPHPEITITYLYLILNLYYKLVLVPRTCTTSTYLYYVLHTFTCDKQSSTCSSRPRASLPGTTSSWQPMQLLAAIPLPVGHALEPPSKVAQLAMLEQRGAGRLLRTADEVGRTVYLHCNPCPIIQSHERVNTVPGGLATMFFFDMRNARADFSYHVGLQLRRFPFFRGESVAAGLS